MYSEELDNKKDILPLGGKDHGGCEELSY